MLYQLKDWLTKAWLIVKHRPLITCPWCKGTGGAIEGYYEPEWQECRECYHHWEELSDYGLDWFAGRLPVLQYLRARVSIWAGLWFTARISDALRCKAGYHDFADHSHWEPGLEICSTCLTPKGVKITDD